MKKFTRVRSSAGSRPARLLASAVATAAAVAAGGPAPAQANAAHSLNDEKDPGHSLRGARRAYSPKLRTAKEAAVKVTQIKIDSDPYQPYRLSQGFRVGDMLFISGQAGIDETGELVGIGDFDAQAEQTFRNLARVLEAGGSSLKDVVKVTIFLTDMANFPKIVELRGTWFDPLPRRHDRSSPVVVPAGSRDRDRGDRGGTLVGWRT